jgi:hypothetical protein
VENEMAHIWGIKMRCFGRILSILLLLDSTDQVVMVMLPVSKIVYLK